MRTVALREPGHASMSTGGRNRLGPAAIAPSCIRGRVVEYMKKEMPFAAVCVGAWRRRRADRRPRSRGVDVEPLQAIGFVTDTLDEGSARWLRHAVAHRLRTASPFAIASAQSGIVKGPLRACCGSGRVRSDDMRSGCRDASESRQDATPRRGVGRDRSSNHRCSRRSSLRQRARSGSRPAR